MGGRQNLPKDLRIDFDNFIQELDVRTAIKNLDINSPCNNSPLPHFTRHARDIDTSQKLCVHASVPPNSWIVAASKGVSLQNWRILAIEGSESAHFTKVFCNLLRFSSSVSFLSPILYCVLTPSPLSLLSFSFLFSILFSLLHMPSSMSLIYTGYFFMLMRTEGPRVVFKNAWPIKLGFFVPGGWSP